MNRKKAKEIARGYQALLGNHKKLWFEILHTDDEVAVVCAFNRRTCKLVFLEQCEFVHELHSTLQLFLEDAVPKDKYVRAKCRNVYYRFLKESSRVSDNLFPETSPYSDRWIETFFLAYELHLDERIRDLEDHGWQIVRIEKIKPGSCDSFSRKIIARIPEDPRRRSWVYEPPCYCSRHCCRCCH